VSASQSLISDFQKFPLTPPPNHLHNPRHPVPQKGRIRIVRDAGRGAVDAAALGARAGAGRVSSPVSLLAARRTNDVVAYGKDVWS
jgi:hypothetical protein